MKNKDWKMHSHGTHASLAIPTPARGDTAQPTEVAILYVLQDIREELRRQREELAVIKQHISNMISYR